MKLNNLDLYITTKCQLNCNGCYLNCQNEEWSYDNLKEIIESNIFKNITDVINILGGEPTISPILFHLITYIRNQNKNVKIVITTNAIRLIHDESYFKEFISCCKQNNVYVNISWHYNKEIIKPLLELKKNNIFDYLIFVPNNVNKLEELQKTYDKMKMICKCVWRPYINPNISQEENKSIIDFLHHQNQHDIQSSIRRVDDNLKNNIELIGISNLDKNFYKNYKCACGHTGIIFVDGLFYYCLSQGMIKDNPIKVSNIQNIMWKRCIYDYCSCDCYELKHI